MQDSAKSNEQLIQELDSLRLRVAELEAVLARDNQLSGLVPICSFCKKIRDSEQVWRQVEDYLEERIGARFTHSICPDCADKL